MELPDAEGLGEMRSAIIAVFRGMENRDHRRDLINRLNYVLQQLQQGHEHLPTRFSKQGVENARRQYKELKAVLVGIDRMPQNQ